MNEYNYHVEQLRAEQQEPDPVVELRYMADKLVEMLGIPIINVDVKSVSITFANHGHAIVRASMKATRMFGGSY